MERRTVGGLCVLVALLLVGVLVATWAHGRGSDRDADALKQRLRALDGVASVRGDYTDAEDLPFVGFSSFVVHMDRDASTDAVLAVVAEAYRDFDGTMRQDEDDLGLQVRGAHVALHTNGPDADEDDVLDVVRFALDERAPGERVAVDLNARDDADLDDDLVSEITLRLPQGTTADDVLPRLTAIETAGAVPESTDISVIAADGSGLGGSRGLPTTQDQQVWGELNAVRIPGAEDAALAITYQPYQIYSSMQAYGFANVTVRTAGQGRLTHEQVHGLIRAHREILAAHHHTYVYNLRVNGRDRAWMRRHGDVPATR